MANQGITDPHPEPINHGRRRFLTATTAVVGAVGAGFVAVPFIKSWNPSERAKLAGARSLTQFITPSALRVMMLDMA